MPWASSMKQPKMWSRNVLADVEGVEVDVVVGRAWSMN